MMIFQHHFFIHKISSQCYKMKLYQCSWIYHSHLRFRLTLRINGRNSYMNPRQRKRRRCWYVTVPIWKNTGETDGNKKTPLHFWSEVFEVINTIWQRPDFRSLGRFQLILRLQNFGGYGQNGDSWDLPVKCSLRLRAKRRFLGFARKSQPSVTGKMSIFGICP